MSNEEARSGAMRDMGVMDDRVDKKLSNLVLLEGRRGLGGAVDRVTCNYWRVGDVAWKVLSQCASTMTYAGIWLPQMSRTNVRILMSYGVVLDKDGTTKWAPHITWMCGALISSHTNSRGDQLVAGLPGTQDRIVLWYRIAHLGGRMNMGRKQGSHTAWRLPSLQAIRRE